MPDYKEDVVHVKAMEQLLVEHVPTDLLSGSLYEEFFTEERLQTFGVPLQTHFTASMGSATGKQQLLVDGIRKACGLTGGVTELRMEESEEGEKQLEEECHLLAAVVAATLEWVPSHRPTTQEVLAMDWFARCGK